MKYTFNDEQLFPRLTAEELAALEAYGDVVDLKSGDILFSEGQEQNKFCIVLTGEVKVTRIVHDQEMILAVHRSGDFTGEVSLLGGGPALATGRAVTESRIRCIPLHEFRSLIASGTPLSIKVLQAITTRRPAADAVVHQREKLISLGRLSAGIAHELNNPAAAAQRAAGHLMDAFRQQQQLGLSLVGSGATVESVERLRSILAISQTKVRRQPLSALERSDQEDQLTEWLEGRHLTEPWKIAPVLAEGGFTVEDLDDIARESQEKCLQAGIRWLASTINASNLIGEIEESTGRISGLVKAIKSYSYMDREGKQEVDVRRGLDDTLTILKHKLKDVEVVRDYDAELPNIWGLGGELNQVWTNIIDNAADALQSSSQTPKRLTIKAHRSDDRSIVVELADNGPGIPRDIQDSIFDPFFTTKPVGSGTGLGLDTCFRIVVNDHAGDLKFRSKPGETRFLVWLPIKAQ